MSAELTDEQSAMREMALEFARTRLAPFAGEWDAKKTLPLETLKEAAALGMGGVTARDEFGGSGLGRLDSTLIFEALATGCPRVTQSRRLPHRQSLLSPDRAASNWRTRPGIEHAGCKIACNNDPLKGCFRVQ